MPTQNVNLGDHQARFIRGSVKRGRYRNASEVVRAGLRLLEQQERENELRIEALRRMVKAGTDELDRGEYTTLTSEGIDGLFARIERGLVDRRKGR